MSHLRAITIHRDLVSNHFLILPTCVCPFTLIRATSFPSLRERVTLEVGTRELNGFLNCFEINH
jgi:hypothetical protein